MAAGRPDQRAVGHYSRGLRGKGCLALGLETAHCPAPDGSQPGAPRLQGDPVGLVLIPKPHQPHLGTQMGISDMGGRHRVLGGWTEVRPGSELTGKGPDTHNVSLAGAGVSVAAMKAWSWVENGQGSCGDSGGCFCFCTEIIHTKLHTA